MNKEIKRRAHVVGIFPNEAAIVRLAGALLKEQTDEWQVTRRSMGLKVLLKTLDIESVPALLDDDEEEAA